MATMPKRSRAPKGKAKAPGISTYGAPAAEAGVSTYGTPQPATPKKRASAAKPTPKATATRTVAKKARHAPATATKPVLSTTRKRTRSSRPS